MDMDTETQGVAATLPALILKLIFSFLSFDDLLSIQKVCANWKFMTMDVLVWKNAPLNLTPKHGKISKKDALDYIARVPYLHTITGMCDYSNEIFEALVENVKDLRKLNIYITYKGQLSTVNFQNVIKKFKRLEFIAVQNNVPAVVESLDMLSNLSNLKTFSLSCTGHFENIKHVCRVIGDGPFAFTKLHIEHKYKTKDSIDALLYLLKKKLSQLTELYLDDDLQIYMEMISNITNLERLKIIDSPKCPYMSVNLGGMTGLKSLSLEVAHRWKYSCLHLRSLSNNIIFPQTIECLNLNYKVDFQSGIVRNIVNSLPNLKVLNVSYVIDPDLDQQLEGISKLSNLHTVIFDNCPALSLSGFECIMKKCRELRKFKISNISFTDSTYEAIKNCKYLQDLTLNQCELNIDKLLPCIVSLKYLTIICVSCCNSTNNKEQFISDDQTIKYIRQECEKQSVKIGTV